MHPHLSSACTAALILYARQSRLPAAYAPQLAALQLPYEYTSDKHLFRVLDGAVGQQVMASLEDKGLTGLSYFYAGYRCFFTTGKAITSLDDMKDLRLGTEDSSQMKQAHSDVGRRGGGAAARMRSRSRSALTRIDGAREHTAYLCGQRLLSACTVLDV